jgi:AraC family transcriptional regulator of adaptative response/methylated-DNA-[protein]-cysteine methyltransferase
MKDGSAVSRAAFQSGYDSLSGFQEAFKLFFGAPPSVTAGATIIRVDRIPTPLGPMLVGATEDVVLLLEFVDRRMLPNQIKRIRKRTRGVFVPGKNDLVDRVSRQLAEYFDGTRRHFELPLGPVGTDFQQATWAGLVRIPFGETRSYAELATDIGRPSAVRAVGKANGDNALAIVIPCHRVVGADGKLVGYGGGLWRKRRLLELEGVRSP